MVCPTPRFVSLQSDLSKVVAWVCEDGCREGDEAKTPQMLGIEVVKGDRVRSESATQRVAGARWKET